MFVVVVAICLSGFSLVYYKQIQLKLGGIIRLPVQDVLRKQKLNWTSSNTTSGNEIYMLSAFYDDRWSDFVPPVISVLSVIQNPTFKENADPDLLYCHLTCSNNNTITSVPVDMKHLLTRSRSQFNFGHKNKQYHNVVVQCNISLITCNVEHVKLSFDAHLNNIGLNASSPYKRVEYPKKLLKKRESFGVCVPLMYGSPNLKRLVEWIEFLRILGVETIVIYDDGITNEASLLLEHYCKEKFVEMIRINIMKDELPDVMRRNTENILTLSDCIYRHMYISSHVVIIDIDEVIVPRIDNDLTLSDLLNSINATNVAQYNFQNVYFLTDDAIKEDFMDKRYSNVSVYLSRRLKLPRSRPGWHTKSIVTPLGCALMHNHYCHSVIHNYKPGAPEHTSIAVSENVGLNQHYRDGACKFEASEKRVVCMDDVPPDPVIADDVMLKYTRLIMETLPHKLEEFNLTNY